MPAVRGPDGRFLPADDDQPRRSKKRKVSPRTPSQELQHEQQTKQAALIKGRKLREQITRRQNAGLD